jgi:WD40 repeat protein
MAVTVAGFAGVFWQWQQAEGRRLEAEMSRDRAERARWVAELERKNADAARQAAVEQERQAKQARRLAEVEEANAMRRLYLHRIALAQSEWQNYRLGRAEELLDECPPEHRSWDWHYLKSLCHGELLLMQGHTDGVRNIAYSPDGEHIATGVGSWGVARQGELIVWNAMTGEPKYPRKIDATGAIMGLAFSPDGKMLAVTSLSWDGNKRGRVRVLDVETGKERYMLDKPGEEAHGVAFSPDGKYLATAQFDNRIRLWNADDGSYVHTYSGHTNWTFEVAFSPDSSMLASVGRDGAVFVWDVHNRSKQPVHTFPNFSDVRHVRFSPDGRYLAFSQWGQAVRIWNVASSPAVEVARHDTFGTVVGAFDFSPDGRRIAISSHDGSLRIIEAISGEELRTYHAHNGYATGVAFSPDGRRLATCGEDRIVKVWDALTDWIPDQTRPSAAVSYGITFTMDSANLLLPGGPNSTRPGHGNKTLAIWNMEDNRMLPVL